jgi:hypothetical protein
LLETARLKANLAVHRVNIMRDEAVYQKYRHRIPVVQFEDGTTIEAPIDPGSLLEAIRSRQGE